MSNQTRTTAANHALQRFALLVLREWHNSGDRGDLDGGWLQDAAEESGVCVETTRTTPCGAVCPCADFEGHGEAVECMPIHDDVFALMREEGGR